MLLLLCSTAFQILDTQMINLIIVLYFMPLFLSHNWDFNSVKQIGPPYSFLFICSLSPSKWELGSQLVPDETQSLSFLKRFTPGSLSANALNLTFGLILLVEGWNQMVLCLIFSPVYVDQRIPKGVRFYTTAPF